MKELTMILLKDTYGVCKLEHSSTIPDWVLKSDLFSVTKTSDELSVVCKESCIPIEIEYEKNWRVLKVEGPLDFSLIGILSSISSILAQNKISIFAISTYDTDYILVIDNDINKAISALISEGFQIIEQDNK